MHHAEIEMAESMSTPPKISARNPVCRQCGGSHESRYMLRIFNKAGSCKDLYSKVYKTYGIKNSFPVPPPKPGKSALGTRFQIHLIWMPDSLDHRSVRNKEVRFI